VQETVRPLPSEGGRFVNWANRAGRTLADSAVAGRAKNNNRRTVVLFRYWAAGAWLGRKTNHRWRSCVNMDTVMKRGSAVATAVVCLLTLLAGCGGASSAATVIGVAGPCVGATLKAQYDTTPLSVNLVRGHHIVGTRAFEGRHAFSFRERPGTYQLVVVTGRLPPNVSSLPPFRIVLRSGHVTHVVLPSCK
jgi:hypothetical protein